MPLRPLARTRAWLLPPSLDELVHQDHTARFVAAFVDLLDGAAWTELGIDPEGEVRGAPAYHPRGLLSVWLYGFMTGVRSSRRLEAACRDQLPYLWLTGYQFPDHNTLWRFYELHREGMRQLLKHSVRTAVRAGLVDLALQAVDGTKIAASAARERTLDEAGLGRLLERTEAAIADLEGQNTGGEEPPSVRLPEKLAQTKALQDQVRQALQAVRAPDGPARMNLTDQDATLMKDRRGYLMGYNAQAMVAGLDPDKAGGKGLLATAGDVTKAAADHGQLLPMLDQARETLGQAVPLLAADGGYHSGPNLVGCEARQQVVVMPEAQRQALKDPYHKDAFGYDPATDSFTCPEGQALVFVQLRHRRRRPVARLYRAAAGVCAACPAFQSCAKGRPQGRSVETGPEEAELRRHRMWMATEPAKRAYRRRKELPEPLFGIVKEVQGVRRFLLRGVQKVRAEWALVLTGLNLRFLYQVWLRWGEALGTGRWVPA